MHEKTNTELFERMPVPRAVWTMAVPTVIGQLIVLIYNMADTFFVGRTNNPYMVAAASLILPVFNISLSLSGLAGVGGGAVISRLLGRHETEQARLVYSFSVWLALAVSALFSVATFVFLHPLLSLLGADANTHDFAASYAFFVIICGGIPTVLSNTFSTLLRSVGESKKAAFGITMGGLINIGLDPLLMFVLLPRGMEITGAGAATCLSNLIACGYFIVVLLRRRRSEAVLKLCPPWKLPSGKNIGRTLALGVPSAVNTLLFDLDYVVIDRLMSGYNDLALAAVGIVLKVERLPLNIGVGICQGMLPLLAYNHASDNLDRMQAIRRYSLQLGLVLAAISITLYELFPGQILHIFINEAQTEALGTVFLRIRVLATPLMFLSFFHVYLFNSFGKGNWALFLGLTRWTIFNIPMLFLLNTLLGINGLVWSQLVGDALTVILSFSVYEFYRRRYLIRLPAGGKSR